MVRKLGRPNRIIAILLALFTVLIAVTVYAAEFDGGEVYRLPAGEVVNDDLYVGASEIYIDGTVDGDLIAAGGYIEINGVVTGDVLAAGAGIKIRGQVGDDVRVAGAGIDLTGVVADDFFAAGGGTPGGFSIPIQIGNTSVQQGVRLADVAEIGGDAAIVGGTGDLAGQIGGDLVSGMSQLSMSAHVGGNAELNAGQLFIDDQSRVEGTLKYSTSEQLQLPADIASNIQFEQVQQEVERANPLLNFLGWIVRTVLMIVGFAVFGWLILRFAPNLLTGPVSTLETNPVEAGLYGLLVAVLLLFIPVATAVLVGVIWLFWGVLPALVVGFTLLSLMALVWLFSPLITGLWLGKQITERVTLGGGLVISLAVGVVLLVILGRVPCLGWLIYLLSFILALGSVVRYARLTSKGEELLLDVSEPATPA
jgi:cytoskeletal protein CcmA (bactofilin family)